MELTYPENKTQPSQFARGLNECMQVLEIRDQELAKTAGVDKSTINRWKTGTHPNPNQGCEALRKAVCFLTIKIKGLRAEAGEKAKTLGEGAIENLLQNLALELSQFKDRTKNSKAKKAAELLEDEYLCSKKEGLDAKQNVFQLLIAAELLKLKANDLYYKSKEAQMLRDHAFCLRIEALKFMAEPAELLKYARCFDDEPSNKVIEPTSHHPTMEIEAAYRLEMDLPQMTKEQVREIEKEMTEWLRKKFPDDPNISISRWRMED